MQLTLLLVPTRQPRPFELVSSGLCLCLRIICPRLQWDIRASVDGYILRNMPLRMVLPVSIASLVIQLTVLSLWTSLEPVLKVLHSTSDLGTSCHSSRFWVVGISVISISYRLKITLLTFSEDFYWNVDHLLCPTDIYVVLIFHAYFDSNSAMVTEVLRMRDGAFDPYQSESSQLGKG